MAKAMAAAGQPNFIAIQLAGYISLHTGIAIASYANTVGQYTKINTDIYYIATCLIVKFSK